MTKIINECLLTICIFFFFTDFPRSGGRKGDNELDRLLHSSQGRLQMVGRVAQAQISSEQLQTRRNQLQQQVRCYDTASPNGGSFEVYLCTETR